MDFSLLNDINQGFSIVEGEYVRHPNLRDDANLHNLVNKFLSLAKRRGILSLDEAIKRANTLKTWTDRDEIDLTSLKKYYNNLCLSYEKVISSQQELLQEDLQNIKIKLTEILTKRQRAIGKTAEDWADKLAYERYVLTLISDKDLQPKFSSHDIEFLERYEVQKYINIFESLGNTITDDNIKSLACGSYCQNLVYIHKNGNLFNAPALSLTNYQQRLCLYINYYNEIIKNLSGKVSDDILTNWKELEKWAKTPENQREHLENSWGGQSNSKINYENIRRASMKEGSDYEKDLATASLLS